MFGTLDYELLDDFIHTNVAGPLKIAETFIGEREGEQAEEDRRDQLGGRLRVRAALHAERLAGAGSLLVSHHQGRLEQRDGAAEPRSSRTTA